jgi:hypothetical protein
MPQYLCNAGCKFCYVKQYWEKPSEETSNLVITPEYKERLFKFLGQFTYINCIDNLAMLKSKFPNIFEFYKENSNKMSYGCLTDGAIVQQFDIVMGDMNFRSIHEISLTDDYISKTPDIIKYIEGLNARYNIRIIKFIYTFNDKAKSDATFAPFAALAKAYDIDVIRHKNIMDDKYHDGLYDLSDTEFHFKPLYAEGGKIFHILGDGAIHIYYDKLKFSTDDGTSSMLLPEFGTIDDLGYDLIIKLIKGKVLKYVDYVKNMKNKTDNLFYDYYLFVTEKLIVNDKCNFIPEFILTKDACFYDILVKAGWTPTKYGLLKLESEQQTIVPLVTWSNAV